MVCREPLFERSLLQPYELGVGMEVYVGNISGRGKGVDARFGGDEHALSAVRPEVALGEAFVGCNIRMVVWEDDERRKCLYQFCYNHEGTLEVVATGGVDLSNGDLTRDN